MWMTDYIQEIQRQLIEVFGYKKGDNGCPKDVPDGAYPMLIEKKLDLVMVVNGGIWCCNFVNDKGGLKEFQKNARGQYAKMRDGMGEEKL